jgi:rhamnogalacturonan acetylesterase
MITLRSSRHLLAASLSVVFLAAAGVCRAQQDERPVVDDSKTAPEKAVNNSLPTIWVVGDSTLKSSAPMRGWGDELSAFFDKGKINVVNRAIGGRSSRTFQTEGRWDKALAEMKKGDYLLVQFGHNDAGRYDDPAAKNRPSLRGEGEDTKEIAHDLSKPDSPMETVHSFGWYMRKYGADAKANGVKAIFCSMVPHKSWDGAKVKHGEHETFALWTANAAKATGGAYIDLNELVAREYEKIGPAAVEPLFADKGTHTSPAGAELNAHNVVAGLRALPGAPLDKYLSDKGKGVTAAPAELVADAAAKP